MTTSKVIPVDHPEGDRLTHSRVKIKIPKFYQHDPIISRLISHHGLEVNILAALLTSNQKNDGWFDLELKGNYQQISDALFELAELDVEVWHQSGDEVDGW